MILIMTGSLFTHWNFVLLHLYAWYMYRICSEAQNRLSLFLCFQSDDTIALFAEVYVEGQ